MGFGLRIGTLLAALFLIATAGLLAMGMRGSAGRVDAAVVINAPPDVVWTWINEPDKLKRWVDWLYDVRLDISAPAGLGAKAVWLMRDEANGRQLIQVYATCVEYVPPTRLVLSLSSPGRFYGTQSYTITPVAGDRSRLEIDARYRYTPWYARLVEPLVTPLAQNQLKGDVLRLNSAVTSGM